MPCSCPPMRTRVTSAMLPGSGLPSAARIGGVLAGQRMATARAISASPAMAAGVQPSGLPGQAGWPDRCRAQRTPSSAVMSIGSSPTSPWKPRPRISARMPKVSSSRIAPTVGPANPRRASSIATT